MSRPKGIFLLNRDAYDSVYAPFASTQIESRVEIVSEPQTARTVARHPELLSNVDLVFSGWGCPTMDERFMQAAPRLKAVFYAAGAISGWATPAVWNRDVIVTTANEANAIPVAEYTLATMLFSLKRGWFYSREYPMDDGFMIRNDILGAYKSVIGLVGMGTIARMVAKMLTRFNATILVHDPFLTDTGAASLGVVKSDLKTIFASSDVVSLHVPSLPSTHHMIDGILIASMKTGATLINTARGAVIAEQQLIQVLKERADLTAVLDVTEHQPLSMGSPLRTLQNVVLTPHIGGSQGRECQRMGAYMVEELDRYLVGQPLRWRVQPTQLEYSVHTIPTKRACESLPA